MYWTQTKNKKTSALTSPTSPLAPTAPQQPDPWSTFEKKEGNLGGRDTAESTSTQIQTHYWQGARDKASATTLSCPLTWRISRLDDWRNRAQWASRWFGLCQELLKVTGIEHHRHRATLESKLEFPFQPPNNSFDVYWIFLKRNTLASPLPNRQIATALPLLQHNAVVIVDYCTSGSKRSLNWKLEGPKTLWRLHLHVFILRWEAA